jgi:DNA-directed RNA polymerase subunit A'
MSETNVYKRISSIVFGVMSPKIVRKMSAAKIVTPELYDQEGYPVEGGLMDTRLGVVDPGLRCRTCGSRLKECTGHFGHIELARPVMHIKFIGYIYDSLRSFCLECNKILIDDEKLKGLKSIKEVRTSARNVKKCPHCKAKQKKIKLEKPSTFVRGDKQLTPIEVKAFLEKISDESLETIGINADVARPEWMIITYLAVPPVTIRPSITLESGERSEDDLTHKMGDIVRINQRLFENINAGAPEVIVEDLWDLLQYHVTTYFDNAIAQVPPARHRSGQPLKTLSERIKSKEGRFRHNLAGKRVNFAARTVISPDPKIKMNEVGIPLYVAMDLTIPVRVQEWNKEYILRFIKNGDKVYPGANYAITPDGKKKKITDETKEQIMEEIENGYVVERHLVDGDVSIFNRQPSLHRMSIMCHKVRILPGKSFRLNPAVCAPYNADFDGDEMNLHIPQTEEARAEADILMQVQTQLITPKNGLNVMGCIDDAITGNYILTKDLVLSKEEAVGILYSIGVNDFSKLKGNEISGKDIFSSLLPTDFDFIDSTRKGEDVKIKKGMLTEGYIDKAAIGDSNGSLIRALYKEYGEMEGLTVLWRIFRLGIEVLFRKGFTTSLSDTDIQEDIKKKNYSLIDKAEENVDEMIKLYGKNKLDATPGLSVEETLESMILKELNKVRDKIGEHVSESADIKENSTVLMAIAGAKGNLLNLAQMAACVGQQALSGSRVGDGYRNRTLSSFKKNSLEPASRGFIRRGYKDGLKPYEFFFHAMTGRDSLMDTALRTPKSGYLYRRLVNALQDLRIEYDSTVRDGNKRVVQFTYGDDGIDIGKSEGGTINVKRIVKEIADG